MDASLGPILVVEDDQDHALLIRSVFESRSRGTVICIASTGREALDYLEGIPPYDDRAENPLPEVIILDLGLPDMNGFDVLSWLSVSEEYSDIPVVVFTSSTDPADARMAYSLGARSYKTKPADFGGLVDVVREVLGKWLGPSSLSLENDVRRHAFVQRPPLTPARSLSSGRLFPVLLRRFRFGENSCLRWIKCG